jgi:hypothetical protein
MISDRARIVAVSAFTAALCAIVAPPQPAAPSSRIVAVGDIHGASDAFVSILETADLVDRGHAWSGGAATLVQTGDFMDRGAGVRATMDILMNLERSAASGGGRAHILMGNHEAMNLLGETRDVTPAIYATFADAESEKRREEAYKAYSRLMTARAGQLGVAALTAQSRDAWTAAHPPGYLEYRAALAPDGVYGRWLRTRQAAVKVGDTVFLHGGVSPDMAPGSIDDLNRQVAREIKTFDDYRAHLTASGAILPFFTLQEVLDACRAELQALAAAQSAAEPEREPILTGLNQRHLDVLQGVTRLGSWMVLNPNGPLWFRGYATWSSEQGAPQIGRLLEKYKARRFVVGHTIVGGMRIAPRFDRRVFLIDTGMLSTYYAGGRASALEIAGGTVVAIYGDGRTVLDRPQTQALPLAASPR